MDWDGKGYRTEQIIEWMLLVECPFFCEIRILFGLLVSIMFFRVVEW